MNTAGTMGVRGGGGGGHGGGGHGGGRAFHGGGHDAPGHGGYGHGGGHHHGRPPRLRPGRRGRSVWWDGAWWGWDDTAWIVVTDACGRWSEPLEGLSPDFLAYARAALHDASDQPVNERGSDGRLYLFTMEASPYTAPEDRHAKRDVVIRVCLDASPAYDAGELSGPYMGAPQNYAAVVAWGAGQVEAAANILSDVGSQLAVAKSRYNPSRDPGPSWSCQPIATGVVPAIAQAIAAVCTGASGAAQAAHWAATGPGGCAAAVDLAGRALALAQQVCSTTCGHEDVDVLGGRLGLMSADGGLWCLDPDYLECAARILGWAQQSTQLAAQALAACPAPAHVVRSGRRPGMMGAADDGGGAGDGNASPVVTTDAPSGGGSAPSAPASTASSPLGWLVAAGLVVLVGGTWYFTRR